MNDFRIQFHDEKLPVREMVSGFCFALALLAILVIGMFF